MHQPLVEVLKEMLVIFLYNSTTLFLQLDTQRAKYVSAETIMNDNQISSILIWLQHRGIFTLCKK